MAVQAKASKAQAVRDYLKTHRTAKNSEVVEALAKKGIAVGRQYVYLIKKKSKAKRRAVKKVVAERGVGLPEVKAALALLKAAGSIEGAKAALAAAQEIIMEMAE